VKRGQATFAFYYVHSKVGRAKQKVACPLFTFSHQGTRGKIGMNRIHILLPVHNRRQVTSRFIQCLKNQTYGNYHLILIDDGSTDGTEEMVRNELSELTVIRGKGNWWWAGSLEQGYRWLLSEHRTPNTVVLIMNDDTRFGPEFLQTGLSILEGHPRTLLLAECYGLKSRRFLGGGVHADWRRLRFEQARTADDINCLSTMGLFLRLEDFANIGGFHPRLLPHFTSDYEFTTRACRKGYKLMTDPSLKLWVDEETSWNREPGKVPFSVSPRGLLSKRSPHNPVMWTFFVALACPWPWKLLSWLRVWLGTGLLVYRCLFSRTPPDGRSSEGRVGC
jgi:GT2 family glycosyltransferase